MIEIGKKPTGETCCCAPGSASDPQRFTGCMICGRPLVYEQTARPMRCAVCGRETESSCACEDGHFVCDACHEAASIAFFAPVLLASTERDPLRLLEQTMALPQVHMHGPEHHVLVPCVLLTAYRNNGGEIDLSAALKEAVRRAKQVPGGACGYWGVCGAAAGAGIYMSILLGSNPVHKEAWPLPQRLVADCLNTIADVGGPRCCKRTGRLAVTRAAAYTADWLGVDMPLGEVRCRYFRENRECLLRGCPYFPAEHPPAE
jgi:hypothetical protein